MRAYSYHVVTRFGERKAVYLASASHCARYSFHGDCEVMHVAVEDRGPRESAQAGELDDRSELEMPMLDYPPA